jgi:DNA primase
MTDFLDLNERVIGDIRSAADIVEIIGEHTTLKKAGKSWKGLCPFHREKTPSFTVDRDRGLFYCFGCGAGGDLFGFVRQIERVEFREAAEILARRYGIEIPRRTRRTGEDRRPRLLAAVAAAHEAYVERLWRDANAARAYLESRGVPEEEARSRRLGFAPDAWDFLATSLKRDHAPEILVEAGLLQPGAEGKRPYDRFRNRLLFPIQDERGRVVAFGGRALGAEEPKYLNSPDSPLFAKNRILYGLTEARPAVRSSERAVLVEGYFDHLALALSGVPESVATMGTALSSGQAERLRRFASRIVICYDADEAGRKATRRAMPILLAAGLEVSVAELARGLDPFDVYRESGPSALSAAVDRAAGFLDWLLRETLAASEELSAEEKGARVQAILEILASVPDRVRRYEYVRRLAEASRIPVEVLWGPTSPGRPGGPRPGTKSPEKAMTQLKVPAAERRLLQHLLGGEEAGPGILERIDPDLWSDPRSRAIFLALRSAEKSGAPLDFSVLASQLKDDGERAFLSEVVLEEAPTAAEENILSVLRSLEKRRLDREAEAIQRAIAAAEIAGDREEIDRLYRSKLVLARRIHELDREPSGRKPC